MLGRKIASGSACGGGGQKGWLIILMGVHIAWMASVGWGAKPRPAWVIPEVVKVRSGPSLDSKVIGTLSRGTKVYVIAFREKWCWCSLPEGGKGWIAEWLLQFSADKGRALAQEKAQTALAAVPQGHPPAWIKVTAANVRSAPGLGGKAYGTLSQGTKVYVLARQGDWIRCKTPGGSGWIRGDLLEYDIVAGRKLAAANSSNAASSAPTATTFATAAPNKAFVAEERVVLRTGPGSRFPKKAALVKGQTLYIAGSQGMWRKVKVHGGTTGWVAAWLIKEASPNSGGGEGGTGKSLAGNPDTPEVARMDQVLPAWVTAETARVREGPSTEAKVKFTVSQGTKLQVAAVCGHWCKVRTQAGNYGWIAGWLIKFVPPGTAITAKEAGETVEVNVGWVARPEVNVRSGPSTESPSIGEATLGTRLLIIGKRPGWYKVVLEDGNIGWIAERLIDTRSERLVRARLAQCGKAGLKSTSLAQATMGTMEDFPAPTVEGAPETSEGGDSFGSKLVATAMKYLGCAYVRGGSRPGAFDCSGFVSFVHRLHGIDLSRDSRAQFLQGTPVARDDLQPGDVLFFENTYRQGISHVGIYIGNGKFIHASNHRGGVKITDLDSEYYARRYVGARRMY